VPFRDPVKSQIEEQDICLRSKVCGAAFVLRKGGMAAGLGLFADLEAYPQNVNRNSKPSDLKITDMRVAVLSQNRDPEVGVAAARRVRVRGCNLPRGDAGLGGMGQILVRIDTNQGSPLRRDV